MVLGLGERLLRALLLQVFYSIRSENLLMEQLDYNWLFRWFVGLEIDDRVSEPTGVRTRAATRKILWPWYWNWEDAACSAEQHQPAERHR